MTVVPVADLIQSMAGVVAITAMTATPVKLV
jgi:hypothetical protein